MISTNSEDILGAGDVNNIEKIKITSYEPAYGIIGDPAKKNPTTRQSADHSMCYIISSILRKALEKSDSISADTSPEELWKYLMLVPQDYGKAAIYCETTR